MNKAILITFFATYLGLAGCSTSSINQSSPIPLYEEITIVSEFGIANPALYFKSEGHRAAILVHDFNSNRQDWIAFAIYLQTLNITSIAIEKIGRRDVFDAIEYLKQRNHKDIILIGASMGGGAAIQAANQRHSKIEKIILISTTNPAELKGPNLKKLFIVSKRDPLKSMSYSAYNEAAYPKELKEYEGKLHGQALLRGKQAQLILSDISDFIFND